MANQDNKINKIKLPNGQVYEIDAKYWNGKETLTAADLGLSAALKYCGITTTKLEDGSTVNPVIIDGNDHFASAGCVVFYEDKEGTQEFVYNGLKWELLGKDLTYKVVQNPISSPNVSGDATAFIDTISQDANGVITVTKKNVDMPIVKGDAENSAVLKGGNNQATNVNEVALGNYNKSNSDTCFSIGIGTSDTDRKNAFEVKKNGDIYIEGVEGKIQDKLNEISQINKTIEDNEEVIATALCELNEKVGEIEKTQEKVFIWSEDMVEEEYDEPDENGFVGKMKQEYVIDILENGYTKILSIEDGIPYVYELDYFDLPNDVLKLKLRIEHVQENNTGETINIIEINTNRDSVDFCKYKMQLFIYNFPFTYSGTSTPENSDGYKYLNFINSVITDDIDLPEKNKQLFKKNMGLMSSMVKVTYLELKSLRDNSKLIPGQQYRITDYVTTTSQSNTQSAGHQFDIIVTADDVNVLNENARAIQHTTDDDDYFSNSDLNAWELKYCLDNDKNRFVWAATDGKGVIYYMKDEWNNECPYDFKNIQFARWQLSNPVGYRNDFDFDEYVNNWVEETTPFDSLKEGFYGLNRSDNVFSYGYDDNDGYDKYKVEYTISESPTYCYTFGKDTDYSISGRNYGNVIKEYKNSNKIQLNNIVFLSNNCYQNSFGYKCYSNTFGNGCHQNSFGNSCYSNTFGNYCYSNTFGYSCYSNTFGNYCYSNSFGNSCNSNSFGKDCDSNIFGNSCQYNSFGNYCNSNSFGNKCNYNIFGNECISNTFGNKCSTNSFRRDGNDISLVRNKCQYNHFGDEISNLTIYNTSTSTTGALQNIYVNNLFKNTYRLVEVRVLDSIYKITLSNVETDTYDSINVDYGSKQWRHVTARATIYCTDKYIVLDNTSNINIILPEPWDGAEFYFYKRSSTSYSVSYDGGTNYISDGHQSSNSEIRNTKVTSTSLGESKIVWDPSANEWLRTYMG